MPDHFIVIHPDGHTSDERIPGEHDSTTLTHREPGAMGGRPSGADIPRDTPTQIDEQTRHDRELEGGGER